jgi:TolA-binding protein
MPCPSSASGQKLEVKPAMGAGPAVAPPAASVTGVAAEMQWVHRMERERKLKEQRQRISDLEGAIDERNRRMQDEMAAIQNRKAQAKNNLAGATWEQSLSTEMQAVAAKYQALNDADQARLTQLRAELEQMQRAPPGDSGLVERAKPLQPPPGRLKTPSPNRLRAGAIGQDAGGLPCVHLAQDGGGLTD